MDPQSPELAFGETVYDEDGNEVGHVRGADEHGLYVTTIDGIASLSGGHDPLTVAGEKELMWRCSVCGRMGELSEGIPESCPDCTAIRENIYFWTED